MMTLAKRKSSENPAMAAVERYRNRMRGRGMVRVEVQVAKSDATLIRAVASALADPLNAPELRALLRDRLGQSPKGLKMLLESAPLEGIRIERRRERGRRVAL